MKGPNIMIYSKRRHLFSVEKFFDEDVQEKLIKKKRIWIWLAIVVVSAFILVAGALGPTETYEAGDISTESLIYEGSSFTYTSEVAYDEAVAAIESDINDVYTLDSDKLDNIHTQIDDFIGQVSAIKELEEDENADAADLYSTLLGSGDDASANEEAIKNLSLSDITNVADNLGTYFDSSYAEGIKEADLESFLENLDTWIDDGHFSGNQQTVAHAVVNHLTIEANYVLNEEETAAVTAKRIAEIEPVEVTVRSGQKIVDEGTVITAEQMETLQKAGMLTERKGVGYFLGVFGYVLFLFFLLVLYCKRFFPFYAFEKEGILLIGSVVVVFLALSQVILLAAAATTGTLYSVLGYLLPLPAVGIIFATLTNQRLSFIMVTFCAMLMALLVTNQPSYLIAAICGMLFTVYTVGRIRERYQVVSFGFYLGLVNALVILILGLIGEQSLKTVAVGCSVGLMSGFISAFFALGSLPLLENSLKLTTPMKLMELSSSGHPLIKRLMEEAPGTYYHSVLVGNLAEAAADAIGADALLVRIASYYHDIGKLERPAYFTENQEPGNNPHDKLAPTLSALILVSHVKDGVEMAKEYGLPEDVVNIIAEHHGNNVIKYFYNKAKERGDEVTPEDFAYPFPKPQTRESAVVMMADCVQAAMQSMVPMTKGETTAKIHELIKERLNDGQFEECDLTFKDLHVIQEAFVSVYDGMTHNRVRYPELKALAKKSGISVEIDENGEENVSEKNTAPSKKKPSAESTDGIPVKNNEPPEKAAGQNEAQGEDH
jgi:hypothetical protein